MIDELLVDGKICKYFCITLSLRGLILVDRS